MDIPIADQIVQVGHACVEAGSKFKKADETIHLIVVGVASEKDLLIALEKLELRGIQFAVFHEPDDKMGFTAACTEPLTAIFRREFRNYPLWNSSREVTKT